MSSIHPVQVIAVTGGKIAAIGCFTGSGTEEIDARGRIVAIYPERKPLSLTPVGPDTPVLGILELRGGEAAARGIRRGLDPIELDRAGESVDLQAVHEQTAGAFGLVLFVARAFVGLDCAIMQPNFAFLHTRESALERD